MTPNEFRDYLRKLQENPYNWPNDYFAWEKPDKTLFMVGINSTQMFQVLKHEVDEAHDRRLIELGHEPDKEYHSVYYGISPNCSYMSNGQHYDPVEKLVGEVSGYKFLGTWRDPDILMDQPHAFSKTLACGRWELAKSHILQQEKAVVDDKERVLSPEQEAFFAGSKIRDENGRLLTMYHGTSHSFDTFDLNHIRANESDADYNGFWFSDNPNTLPAWTRLNERYEVYLNVTNPAPMDIVRQVEEEVWADFRSGKDDTTYCHPETRSVCDEVRLRLQDMGYDGIIHDWKPEVDREELEREGRTVVTSARGRKYVLAKDEEYGGIDLFYYDRYDPNGEGECLTGYSDVDDYLNLQERTVVVFRPEQIKSVDNRTPTQNPNFQHNDPTRERPDGTPIIDPIDVRISEAHQRSREQNKSTELRRMDHEH